MSECVFYGIGMCVIGEFCILPPKLFSPTLPVVLAGNQFDGTVQR